MTPKEEVEEVMNAGLPFATKMLEEHDEFYPFAFAMTAEGKVVAVAVADSDEHPESQGVAEHLVDVLAASVSRGEYTAIGLFLDVRVQRPGSDAKVDAIQVGLEHSSGYCVDVFWPYSKGRDGKLAVGGAFASHRVGTAVSKCK